MLQIHCPGRHQEEVRSAQDLLAKSGLARTLVSNHQPPSAPSPPICPLTAHTRSLEPTEATTEPIPLASFITACAPFGCHSLFLPIGSGPIQPHRKKSLGCQTHAHSAPLFSPLGLPPPPPALRSTPNPSVQTTKSSFPAYTLLTFPKKTFCRVTMPRAVAEL